VSYYFNFSPFAKMVTKSASISPIPPSQESSTANAMPIILDVAIAGGGIAGLATAIGLRRAGHRVTVS
jgi:NADPH-dependent 2,4-dienoyl-CoA reductase/sulfur reductase-like enzyme